MNTTLPVKGMTCGGCVNSVKRALSALPGVTAVEVELVSGLAHIEHDREQTPVDALRAAIVQAGFETA